MIRRGLTLLELMLSTAITAMVALALTGMLNAVTTGVITRRDARAAMVGAQTAQTRLSAYIAPSLCVLHVDPDDAVVLWFEDSRESGTVHASEVRWLIYDDVAESITVTFVDFPDDWTPTAEDMADKECETTQDWMALYDHYEVQGWTASLPLVDNIIDFSASYNTASVMDATLLAFAIEFAADGTADDDSSDGVETYISGAIRLHVHPEDP